MQIKLFLLFTILSVLIVDPIWAGLIEYLERPESEFAWEKIGKSETEHGVVHTIKLTSQEWQDIIWKHNLQIFVPPKIDYPDTILLVVSGGSTTSEPDEDDLKFGLKIANTAGSICAVLSQVPNQPLYDGKYEDDLIAHTFEKYLETKDENWPLLFPMVKSAVKAMDAIEQFTEKEIEKRVDQFVVTGASKRGWTSWLTAVVDPRIQATMPIVIDVLNMKVQMDHQKEIWGDYSEQIGDYTQRNLQDQMEDENGKTLFQMVDPYSYRDVLTMPKLSIIGTNDRYWVLDAMNLYWDDLKDPKYVLYVPNSGHGLDEEIDRAIAGLTGFYRFIASGKPLPEIAWEHTDENGKLYLTIETDQQVQSALLWITAAPKRDFREASWVSVPLQKIDENRFRGELNRQAQRHTAIFGELTFLIDDHPCPLSTQLSIGSPLKSDE